MPPKGTMCEALGCESNTRNKTGPFFLFPIDPVRKRKWEENIRMKPPGDRKLRFLCSRHFTQDAFTNSFCWKLSIHAVPTKQYGPLMYKVDMYSSPKEMNNEENLTCRRCESPEKYQLEASPEVKAKKTALTTNRIKKVPPLRLRFLKDPEKEKSLASPDIKAKEIAFITCKNINQTPNSDVTKVKTKVTTLTPNENQNHSSKELHVNLPVIDENRDSSSDESSSGGDDSSEHDDDSDDDLQFFKAIIPFIKYLPHSKKMNLRMKIQEVVYKELYGY